MKALYIINAPPLFTILYKMISLFLDKETLGKIFILSNDGEKNFSKIFSKNFLDNFYRKPNE